MYDASKVYAFAAELAASGQVERPAVLALIRADVLAIKLAYAPTDVAQPLTFASGEALSSWATGQGYKVASVNDNGTPVFHVITACGVVFWQDGSRSVPVFA